MKTVCPNGPVIKGVDLYQGDMISDITLLKPNGFMYAFHKAFEYRTDPRFAARWGELKTAEIIRGAYDFFHPDQDPVSQAEMFCSVVGPLEDGDLPCALDWEVTGGTGTNANKNAALQWLVTVEKLTGKTPIIYASPGFLGPLNLDSRFARFPLWVAHYGVNCPWVPAPWTTWTFWQTTGTGSVPGMSGHCDKDVFNGSMDALMAFIANSKVSVSRAA